MKKFISTFLCFFCIYTLSSHAAKNDFCPYQLFDKLYASLHATITDITWLDINPTDNPNACQFNIRYYPCTQAIQSQLDYWLPLALQDIAPSCVLQYHGTHQPTEGYCTLKNIVIQCAY